ncbi:MAG: alkaline phosphatase family protein [Solirubrobacterales bacterium]
MRALSDPLRRAIAAAATLTGRRFGLLVASSLVATSAIIASAITNPADEGPLAALLGRSLASANAPSATGQTHASSGDPTTERSGSPAGSASETPAPSGVPPAPTGASAVEAGTPEASPSPTPPTPTGPAPTAGRIKHVFVISLASPGYEAAFGANTQMPYLARTLRPEGELLSGYSLLAAAASANEIAAISGQPPNPSTEADCSTYSEFPASAPADKQGVVSGSGCVYPVETLTFADQLASAGLQWSAYMEGMSGTGGKPENCVHPASGAPEAPPPGGYAARQNPFVYFHSLLDLGACASSDLPLGELTGALAKISSTPTYSFIAPDPCNAGVEGQCPAGAPSGAGAADAFLSQWVPKILASPAYKQDGLLIVTFDQANPAASAPATATVGTLLLSRYLTQGSTDASAYNPYSLLRSTEDLFGLSHLAAAGATTVRSFAPALLGETGGD